MTIQYRITNAQECFDRITKLFDEHYKELSVTQELKLNPDYKIYFDADKRNVVKVVLCEDDNELIGYIVFFVGPNLHHKDYLLATEDIYYLKPEYRKGRTGIKMFQFAEKYLKSIGINMIKYTTNIYLDKSRLFEYLGCNFIEKVFIKRIQ